MYDENIYSLEEISIKKNIKTRINEIKSKKYVIKNIGIYNNILLIYIFNSNFIKICKNFIKNNIAAIFKNIYFVNLIFVWLLSFTNGIKIKNKNRLKPNMI